MNTPTLETERLILRKFTKEDITYLYQIYSDKEVNTFLPWHPLTSLLDAQRFYYKQYAAVYEKPFGYHYAICLKEDNIPIGYVHINMDDSHDLGYGLRKEFWHKGIVSEACTAIINQAKKDGLTYITATHDINNPRSGHVMQALGMKYQYSYEELWQPKNFLVTFRMYQLNFDKTSDFLYKKYWNMYEHHFIEKNINKE